MKKSIILSLVLLFAVITVNSQSAPKKDVNPAGTWKYEAPYAPEGYGTGTIIFTLKDKTFSASISFTGSEYKLPAEKVSVAADSVTMVVFIDGADITIKLKSESDTKMSGVAVSPDGEIPLTLVKQVPPAK